MFDGNNALVAFAMYSPAAYTPLADGEPFLTLGTDDS